MEEAAKWWGLTFVALLAWWMSMAGEPLLEFGVF
jgi:hypothetical protein